MKIFNRLTLLCVALLICVNGWAQGKLSDTKLETLSGEVVSVPEFGKKHLLIFYVDPDRHKQNEDFINELEQNHYAESPMIEAFGVINFKDCSFPNFLVRTLTRKRTEKNGALVLADYDNVLSRDWNLGSCNNQFVIIFITKDGELAFLGKGELSKEQQEEFLATIAKYK